MTVDLRPAVRGPYAWGPRVTHPGTITPDCEIVVTSRADPTVEIVRLDQSYSRRWQDQLNEPGSGSIVVQNDDPDLALVSPGDLLTFYAYGTAAFTTIAHQWDRVTIAPNEEVDQATTITGPGHAAVLEEAVIYPARGVGSLPAEEDRRFDWTAPDFDDSDWANSVYISDVPYAQDWWPLLPFAEGFPSSPTCPIIWATAGAEDEAPPGSCFFRKTYTSLGGALIYAVADDIGQLYFDGQLILDMSSFDQVYTATLIDVTPGPHTIAVFATNGPGSTTSSDPNPAGLAVMVYPCDANGQASATYPDVRTGTDWGVVAYPEHPPGWTVGEVLRHVIEEAQARTEPALEGVTLDFTDEVDSEGVAWPVVGDISTKVGTDILTFLRELSATYLDYAMTPRSLKLRAYVRDGRGQTTGVDYHGVTDPTDPTSGNIATLTHRRIDTLANRLLVRWSGGWRENSRTAAVGERREALLGLGAATSTFQVDTIGASQLDRYADIRTEISVDVVPVDDTDTPYLACTVGDTVTVPGWDGVPVEERVLAITGNEDELGQLTFAVDCKDVILQQQERFEEWLKKMSNGTMRGDSKIATPVASISATSTPDCCPPTVPVACL